MGLSTSMNISNTLSLPNVATGTYYLIVQLDDDNVRNEYDEDNNIIIKTLQENRYDKYYKSKNLSSR